MREIHVFDLDGTLIDSKVVTIKAYRLAAQELGMLPPPENVIWGRTAGEWRCPDALHRRKMVWYAKLLVDIKPAWAATAFNRCMRSADCGVHVWTGMSVTTAQLLSTSEQLFKYIHNIRCGVSVAKKAEALGALHDAFGSTSRIHYYDDDQTAVRVMAKQVPECVMHQEKGLFLCV